MATNTKNQIDYTELIDEETVARARKFEKARFRVKDAISALNRSESTWSGSFFTTEAGLAEDFAAVRALAETRREALLELELASYLFEAMVAEGYAKDAEEASKARQRAWKMNIEEVN